jgi:AraC-like DNA-binding protein
MMSAQIPSPSMGVLQSHVGAQKFELSRYEPAEPLKAFVKHYWVVSWTLAEHEHYDQAVVPNPCVNLVMEQDRSGIYGVTNRKYTKHLQGSGLVFGIKFLPGGFYPYWPTPLSELTDRSLMLSDVFGTAAAAAYEQAISATADTAARIRLTDSLLLAKLPDQDPNVAWINRIIDRIRDDRELSKVEQLCEMFDLNKRKLQRLFSQYVGVSPKWAIQLYRLQNAAEWLDQGLFKDWSSLALELGYYDQAHFIKDFKSIIGVTPDEYTSRAT